MKFIVSLPTSDYIGIYCFYQLSQIRKFFFSFYFPVESDFFFCDTRNNLTNCTKIDYTIFSQWNSRSSQRMVWLIFFQVKHELPHKRTNHDCVQFRSVQRKFKSNNKKLGRRSCSYRTHGRIHNTTPQQKNWKCKMNTWKNQSRWRKCSYRALLVVSRSSLVTLILPAQRVSQH